MFYWNGFRLRVKLKMIQFRTLSFQYIYKLLFVTLFNILVLYISLHTTTAFFFNKTYNLIEWDMKNYMTLITKKCNYII